MGASVSSMFMDYALEELRRRASGYGDGLLDEKAAVSKATTRLHHLVLALSADEATTFEFVDAPEQLQEDQEQNNEKDPGSWGTAKAALVGGDTAEAIVMAVARQRLLNHEVWGLRMALGDRLAAKHAEMVEGGSEMPLRALVSLAAKEAVRATLEYVTTGDHLDRLLCKGATGGPHEEAYPRERKKYGLRCELFRKLVPYLAGRGSEDEDYDAKDGGV
jgi:hypothetical protein